MQTLTDIRAAVLTRLQRSIMYQRIMEGGLDKNLYAGYLVNVYHYAQHSPKVIGMAGARAANTHPELAAYLLHHATEEIGHERWARSDLIDLGLKPEQISASRPNTACLGMIGMEYYIAGTANPVSLFGWMFTLEALGDDVGHLISRQLDRTLTLEGRGAYFLAGHGDADHDHIQEITQTIEKHMRDPSDLADTLHVAHASADLYLRMLDEVVEEDRRWI